MKSMKDLIADICSGDGNFRMNEIYISPCNMDLFASKIAGDIELEDLLITPFLIDIKKKAVYELHYYEFFIEMSTVTSVCFCEYEKENKLAKEIVESIHPKAMVPFGDNMSYRNVVESYLYAMKHMKFETERKYLLSVSSSTEYKLFFALY